METLALFGMEMAELTERMAALGQKPYRARQVFEALYRQRVNTLEEIMTIPVGLTEALQAQRFVVGLPEIVQTAKSVDGTERYLVRMADGETVETVWMPGGDGGERGDGSEAASEEEGEDREQGSGNREQGYKRATICISSQVGCAVNCQFCLTAKLGMR